MNDLFYSFFLGGGGFSRLLNCICRRFGTLCSIFIRGVGRRTTRMRFFQLTPSMQMKQAECSKTSSYKNSDAGELPKRKNTTFRRGRKFEIKIFSFLPPWIFEILQTFVKPIDPYFYKFISYMRMLLFIRSISGGIVNILGGGSVDFPACCSTGHFSTR